MAINPGSCVAITPSTRKNGCGNNCYDTKQSKIFHFFPNSAKGHSLIFRILQKVIFSEMTYGTKHSKFEILSVFKISVFDQILEFLQKVFFADLTFITPSTMKKRSA